MSHPKRNSGHLKITVSKTGDVEVDAEEFLSHPEVVKQIDLMRKINFVGAKLDFNAPQGKSGDTSADK